MNVPGMPTREEWGVYCPHNVKIIEADPERTDSDGYPIGRTVHPWPCQQGCTLEQYQADLEAEEAEYWDSLWSDYWATH